VLGPRPDAFAQGRHGTNDVQTAIKEYGAGKGGFRQRHRRQCYSVVGKQSFNKQDLADNINAMPDHLRKMKPATSKELISESIH